MRQFKRICVYCGSSDDVPQTFKSSARKLGQMLAERGIGLVYGGGRVGLMGQVADGALDAGGQVYGVIPRKLMDRELGHTGCTDLFVVDGMHARKSMMANLSDAFIAMPGGWGTLEELCEMTTWTQLRYQDKPVGLLNVDGYWDPFLQFLEQAADLGFIRPVHRGLVVTANEGGDLLKALAELELPELERWLDSPADT